MTVPRVVARRSPTGDPAAAQGDASPSTNWQTPPRPDRRRPRLPLRPGRGLKQKPTTRIRVDDKRRRGQQGGETAEIVRTDVPSCAPDLLPGRLRGSWPKSHDPRGTPGRQVGGRDDDASVDVRDRGCAVHWSGSGRNRVGPRGRGRVEDVVVKATVVAGVDELEGVVERRGASGTVRRGNRRRRDPV